MLAELPMLPAPDPVGLGATPVDDTLNLAAPSLPSVVVGVAATLVLLPPLSASPPSMAVDVIPEFGRDT